MAGHADAWLLAASHYDVEFVITGSNYDAIHYTARVRLDVEETELSHYVTLRWLTEPTQSIPIRGPAN